MGKLMRWTGRGLLPALLLAPLWQAGCVFDTTGSSLTPEGTPGSDASLTYRQHSETTIDTVPVDLGSVDQLAPSDLVADLGYDSIVDLRPDSPADLRPPDAPVPDAPVPDAPVPDVPPPDTGLSCDDVFWDVPNYMACSEESGSCMFYFKGEHKLSCTELCEARGWTCTTSAEEKDDSCTPGKKSTCEHEHGDGLCSCTR